MLKALRTIIAPDDGDDALARALSEAQANLHALGGEIAEAERIKDEHSAEALFGDAAARAAVAKADAQLIDFHKARDTTARAIADIERRIAQKVEAARDAVHAKNVARLNGLKKDYIAAAGEIDAALNALALQWARMDGLAADIAERRAALARGPDANASAAALHTPARMRRLAQGLAFLCRGWPGREYGDTLDNHMAQFIKPDSQRSVGKKYLELETEAMERHVAAVQGGAPPRSDADVAADAVALRHQATKTPTVAPAQ